MGLDRIETGLLYFLLLIMSNARFEFLENNYYHVYNRWFDKQFIFRDEQDFERFYSYIVKEQKLFESIKLASYSFLPNHFHLVIHNLETGLQLSDFMRKIQGSYAMYFKKKYSTSLTPRMPIFEWRFKAKIIQDEAYLEKCLAYVNFNALKHGIVDNIDDYSWTSYHQITNKDKMEKYRDLVLDELEI